MEIDMKMKRFISVLTVLTLMLCACALITFASSEPATEVYVTVVDGEGKLAMAMEKIALRDVDGDGEFTVNDALYCAHDAKFEGGAEAGYSSDEGQYGLYITKLWGTANGGSYGYYINNASAMSLSDKVSSGDTVCAFVYTDTTAWSDTYCYFDRNSVDVKSGETVTLKLCYLGYDENWATVSLPAVGATVTVDGVDTGVKTDAEGNVTLTLTGSGKQVISASGDGVKLVPPVCIAQVEGESGASAVVIAVVVGVLVLAAIVVVPIVRSRKK